MLTNAAKLKGLIYVAGDAGISVDQLSTLTQIPQSRIIRLLKNINQRATKDPNEACRFLDIHGRIQMVTKRALNSAIQQFLKIRHTSILTPAAMETLTIIAYRQPVTRIEIDNVRGVNSAVTIQKLLNQKLIKKQGRKKVLGNPITYVTTDAFLNLFGLKSVRQLPKMPNHHRNQDKEAH